MLSKGYVWYLKVMCLLSIQSNLISHFFVWRTKVWCVRVQCLSRCLVGQIVNSRVDIVHQCAEAHSFSKLVLDVRRPFWLKNHGVVAARAAPLH